MAEEEPQKEAENQEQNAEATEAVEAGAEAAEEVAVAEPKAPSMLMPMLLSAVITVVGVGVMVAVILPKQIKTAIAAASAASHHDGNSTDSHGDSHGAEGDSHGAEGDSHGEEGDSHGEGDKEEGAAAGTEDDNPKKPEPIVPEGESIVINPAGSGGTRYLLVEIFLLREDEKDKGFPKAILDHTKLLQAATVDQLSAEDSQSLADPATKERLKSTLKSAYQRLLDPEDQGDYKIDKLIISKWIMQ